MIYDLCIRETYQDKSGATVTKWNPIGMYWEKDGKKYVKLHHIPGQLISVFERKKKEAKEEEGQF